MRYRTKKLVTLGVMAALAVLLSLANWPIFPAAPFLRYEAADVPVLIVGFALGPGPGLLVTLVMAVLMAVITGLDGMVGALMHFLATGALVGAASIVYRQHRTRAGAVAGLMCGTLAMTIFMPVANLVLMPVLYGYSRAQVLSILWILVAFNAIKAGINSAITFVVYKRVSWLVKSLASLGKGEELVGAMAATQASPAAGGELASGNSRRCGSRVKAG
ncbi:MAG: ECF transporter S component [Firmicutes bacterium]|jgi:riboflavin transporter FmnP|nr:ECF transporter S component [Bacillota bacterium]MDH7496640.1 ECF transporter S component [Bacillota bacterium]